MRTVIAFALLSSFVLGCEVDSPCDPRQRVAMGTCLPRGGGGGTGAMQPDAGGGEATRDASAAGDASGPAVAIQSDAGSSEDDAGGAACDEPVMASLGVSCTASEDCGCGAPFCAAMPGAPSGLCTIAGCTTMPDDCPAGYTCFDLAAVGVMGYDAFCIPQ